MDGELVTKETVRPSFSEVFDRVFPWYLSIGMTPREFWEGDVNLAPAFREAWEVREVRKSRDMWVQGEYIYEAMLSVASCILSKRGRDPIKYRDKPLPLTERAVKEQKAQEEREQQEANLRYMEAVMRSWNRKFQGGEANANHD